MSASWYVARRGGAAVGPLSTEALAVRIRAGSVLPDALVWRKGMAKWMPLANVGELTSSVRGEGDGVPSTARLPFRDDSDEVRTQLAIPVGRPIAPGSPIQEHTLMIDEGARRFATDAESDADPPSSDLATVILPLPKPQEHTLVLDPSHNPFGHRQAQGARADAAHGSSDMPTRVELLEPRRDASASAPKYAAISPEYSDSLPPPYPPDFQGPAEPPVQGASPAPDMTALPPPATSKGTMRVAVALVFLVGLALGIIGARRVVTMRQAAPDDKPADDKPADQP